MASQLNAAHMVPVRRLDAEGAKSRVEWGIASECPVEIGVNGKPLAVMMASPCDIEDLAVGFVLSEALLVSADSIVGVDIRILPEGIIADVEARAEDVVDGRIRPRFLEGRSGCGLCGVETLGDVIREAQPVRAAAEIAPTAIRRAFSLLAAHQPLNARTRSVHAAAWCAARGEIVLAREDVGRHNALDKMIGARARGNERDAAGFAIMSSRCSFELVQKAALAGIGVLATISAPTSLALDLADQVGVKVYCLQGDALVAFGDCDE